MTALWLIRHGQTDWNIEGRWQGQAAQAPGLNDAGRAQALGICGQLTGVHFSAIYSSDLLRARQTAELIAQQLELRVRPEPRLREIHLGLWEGMLSADIERLYPGELDQRARNPFYTRAPQGESPQDVADRVIPAVHAITGSHPGESVLIVAHGVSLAVIICHARHLPLDEVYQHVPGNAQPYPVEWV
jgi:broad specificity phosphatase PhoE